MKKRKSLEVAKFGGTEKLGDVKMGGHEHEVDSIEAQSKTKLEQDTGEGASAIIRCFTFGINLQVFQEAKPTRQDLFNAHIKGIEVMLWRDGMTLMMDVQPRIILEDNQYKIFVGARPMRGHILKEVPQTLTQIAHGN